MRINLSFCCLILLFVWSSNTYAQGVEQVGTENTFDVATWNIEWFGNTSNGPNNEQTQFDNVLNIISNAGIDLWAVQEIASIVDFNDLLDALGDDFDGELATNSGEQRIGFIYNNKVVRTIRTRHILESFEFDFAFRPPLQLEAEITLPDTTVAVTLITAHMKAFSDVASYNRRVDASGRLKNHIDFTALESESVIILGDLNDELTRSTSSGRTSPYENFVSDTDNFDVLTLEIETSGGGSFCTNSSCSNTGSMLDHIFITNELAPFYVSNSVGTIPNLQSAISFFGSSTSDHLPIAARFDFKQSVISSIEDESLPVAVSIGSPYPNPFSNQTTISVQLERPSALHISLFDLLGREIDVLSNQEHAIGNLNFTVDASGLSNGIYLIRVTSDQFSRTMPVTVLK